MNDNGYLLDNHGARFGLEAVINIDSGEDSVPVTVASLHYGRRDLVPVTVDSLHYGRRDSVPVTIACLHYGRRDVHVVPPVTIACLYNLGKCVVLLPLIRPTSILGEDLVPHFTISLLYTVGIIFI